jgi:hypothetical protein
MLPNKIGQFGAGLTNVHPLGLVLLAIAIILVLVLKRKYLIVPILFCAFLLPVGEQFVIAGLHLSMLRLLLPIAWVRLLLSGSGDQKGPKFRINSIDKAMALSFIVTAISFTLLWRTFPAFVDRLGYLYSYLGMYFLWRYLIRDWDDVYRAIRALVFLSMILSAEMINEQIIKRDLFGLIGGPTILEIRQGRLRSQASFSHSILAGCFGAILVPLFFILWKRGGKSRLLAAIGVICSTIMTYTSGSSGPVLAYMGGLLGLSLWPLRDHMKEIRWGIVLSLVALQVMMHHPIWWLISRIGVFGGSTAWYRYRIIDLFITHFGEWWLIGTNRNYLWAYGTWDAVNQYVTTGIQGGLLALILLLLAIVRAFRYVGVARKAHENDPVKAISIWALGAGVLSTCVAFFDTSFFDQTAYLWFAVLAMISAVAVAPARLPEIKPEKPLQFRQPKSPAKKKSLVPVGAAIHS